MDGIVLAAEAVEEVEAEGAVEAAAVEGAAVVVDPLLVLQAEARDPLEERARRFPSNRHFISNVKLNRFFITTNFIITHVYIHH